MNQKKIKPLLPCLREKKRYIAFEIISRKKIADLKMIQKEIWDSSLSFLGELGTAKAGLWLLSDQFNPKMQRGILKTNTKYVHSIKSTLALIKSIDKQDVIVRSLGISGVLKKAKEKYIAG